MNFLEKMPLQYCVSNGKTLDKKDKFTTERSQFVDTKVLENPSGLSCGGGPAPQAPGKCEANDEEVFMPLS